MAYRVELTPKAVKQLEGLPKHVRRRIYRQLVLLGADPRRAGTKKLQGKRDLWRIHAGKNYVIVYTIKGRKLLVLVVNIGHRGDIYR